MSRRYNLYTSEFGSELRCEHYKKDCGFIRDDPCPLTDDGINVNACWFNITDIHLTDKKWALLNYHNDSMNDRGVARLIIKGLINGLD